jgi:hypothetical protein
MKFVRTVAGYTSKDKIRSTVIRDKLHILNFNTRIQTTKSNCIHHVEKECRNLNIFQDS